MSRTDKIHVAFGFHVNFYHSYRGDTPDGLGFGSDIRIIRKIIAVLNELNAAGIPVKGTWDCENYFSLEKILPQYAPDIIEGIKERVRKYGDENIIMGYSNGALGAMNEAELTASLELAVSNPAKSGLKDIFGEYEPIVRPQEVMFSPSQVRVYNKCGIKALCLYYSCIPFDAFKTIVPKLPDEEAFNPLTYSYKEDTLTVIPTYSNADVCDAGCLRAWVKKLRKKQESGEINNDLFIFINMDADAVFWETLDIPLIRGKIANTDGIHGLVTEISDLDYIVFDTPGGYIKNHAPVGHIEFTQDTADGNFTGFSSWAEKPYNRKIWTAVERSRALSKAFSVSDESSPSFNDRLLLLSTTHFGLATPVLNIEREKKADELAKKLIAAHKEFPSDGDRLLIKNINGSTFQSVQLDGGKLKNDETVELFCEDLEDYALIDTEEKTVFALMKFRTVKDSYTVEVRRRKKETANDVGRQIKTEKLEFSFMPSGELETLKYKDRMLGTGDFLKSYITYGGEKSYFTPSLMLVGKLHNKGNFIRLKRNITLPENNSIGTQTLDYISVPFSDAVFVRCTVSYPSTPELDSISTENSALGRFTDNRWTECAPFELTPMLGTDIRVIKRNFDGDVSSFRVNSFSECDPKNKTLDSFNHQLSGGFVGLSGGGSGIAFAVSRQVNNSMACCPMRLYADGRVSMNPFGTYFGKQRHHFSNSENEIQNAYTLIAAQGKSLAPSYNGVTETFFGAFFGFDGETPDEKTLEDIRAFSDGCVAAAEKDCPLKPYYGDNVSFQKAALIDETGEKLKSPVLYGTKGNTKKYITYGYKAIKHIIKEQIKAK